MNSDDPNSNIQIIISPNHIPSQSHEQTPVPTTSAAASASPQDESRSVNEITQVATSPQDDNTVANHLTPIATPSASASRDDDEVETPEDLSSLGLYAYALSGMWDEAKPILDKFPNIVRIPLTARGDTALHVAITTRNTTFVEKLVKLMSPEDMLIPNSDGMLPVHLAALTGQHEMMQKLSYRDLLHTMDSKDTERLFFMTIRSNMFDVAFKLFEAYRDNLASTRDEEEHLTALHMLVRKPSEILNMELKDGITGLQLLEKLWYTVQRFEYKRILELITQPSAVLCDAVKSGNVEAVKRILYMSPEILTIKDPNTGRNLLHYTVLYRQSSLFYFLLQSETVNIILGAVDNEGSNVLHLAAHLPVEFEAFSGFRASIQMRREVAWFKEIKKSVPPELRTMRNNKGKTPMDVFYDEHKKLSEETKDAAKGIAESGMLVAALVATIAFAAALTVPGDKTNAWFTVFILTNAVALFTSSASLLSLLSNFTSSRFAGSKFVISLHPSLILGIGLLLISIVAMVVAFTAASFLIFDHTSKWVTYVVASMGLFPILLFLLFQFSFFDDLLWSRFYRLSKLE